MTSYCLIIPYDFEGNTIVLNKNRPQAQRGKYNFPGGRIKEGECPLAASIRELNEETGLEVTAEHFEHLVTLACPSVFRVFVYAARLSTDQLFSAETVTDEKIDFDTLDNITRYPDVASYARDMELLAHLLLNKEHLELPLYIRVKP